MSEMFYCCFNLKKITFSDFNTNKVINMRRMFTECRSLIDLGVSKLNLKETINCQSMFTECSDELFKKMKEYKYIKKEAFILYDYFDSIKSTNNNK